MKINKYFYMGLGGILTLAIAGGALMFSQTTQAAEDDTAVTASGITDELFHGFGPGGGRGGDRPGGRGEMGGRFGDQTYLLDELGITQEDYDAAVESARITGIDQGLEQGLITEAQAEALKEGNVRGMRGFGFFGGQMESGIDREQLLADALGITVEELQTAQENARAAAQAQALEDGLITQEQIDLMDARQALKAYVDQDAIMAEALGISVDEVTAAREDGTLRDLVTASELTPAEMAEAMQAAHAAAVDQAVEDGIITADQAALLQDGMMAGFGGRSGHGRGHGFGPGRGQGFDESFAPGMSSESFSG